MIASSFIYVIPYIFGGIAAVAIFAAVRERRIGKKSTYTRIRQRARQASRRWVMTAILCAAGVALALTARVQFPPPDQIRAAEEAARAATPTPIRTLPPATPNPTLTAKSPFDAPPTITPTQPTPTLTPTLPIATVESAVTPPPGADLRITAIASEITSALRPGNPGEQFPAGVPRIYVFYEYENMLDGMSWSRVLLADGEVIRSESDSWVDGESGSLYYWFAVGSSWPAGDYEVQFYAGDALLASAVFEIIAY